MILKLAAAGLRAQRRTSLALLLACSLLIAATMAMQGLIAYQSERIPDAIRGMRAGKIAVRAEQVRPDHIASIRDQPFVHHAEPAILTAYMYEGTPGYIVGLPLNSELYRLRENLLAGQMPKPGNRELLMLETTAHDLGLAVGDQVFFSIEKTTADMGSYYESIGLTLSGLLQDKSLVPILPVMPLKTLQNILQLHANIALVDIDHETSSEVASSQLEQLVPGSWTEDVDPHGQIRKEIAAQKTQAQSLLERYSLLLLASFALVIWALVTVQARGRQPEWGIQLAMGVGADQLVGAVILQSSALVIAAAILGLGLYQGIALVFTRFKIYGSYAAAAAGPILIASFSYIGTWLWHANDAVRTSPMELLRKDR